jgi:type I restriction enzyme, S subunit
MYFQKALHRVRPCDEILSEFLALNLQIDCRNGVLAGYFTGATIKHLTGRSLSEYPIPVPPLAEQRRIVAKVDQLMALVDELETQLAAAKSTSAALLDAMIHELLNPSAQIIPFPAAKPKRDPSADRAAIGCYAVWKLADHRSFGRTAQMKVLYLAEAHLNLDLGGNYLRDAAGPFDEWIYRFEDDAARQGWFKALESSTKQGNKKIEYRKGSALDAKAAEASALLQPAARQEFDRLLDLFAGKPTEDVEIIATLFAAWNDFLIDAHAPTDTEIVREVREHWHPSKARFTKDQLQACLDWLRSQRLIPQGRGPGTQRQRQLVPH